MGESVKRGVKGHTTVNSIMSLAKRTRAYVGLRLRDIDLVVGQDEMLIALDEYEGATISVLAELAYVRPTTASKIVDRLASRQLIERSVSDVDKRQTVVRLTPKGRETVSKIRKIYHDIDQDLQRAEASYTAPETRRVVETIGDAVEKRLMRIRV